MQVLGIALTAIALAILLVISYAISVLPSPAEIGKKIDFAPPARMAPTNTVSSSAINKGPAVGPEQKEADERQVDDQVASYLMDKSRPLFEICPSLKQAPTATLGPYSPDDFGAELVHNATSENRNPLIESFIPFLRYTLRLSEVENLIQQARDAYLQGDRGLLKKAQFYSQLLRTREQIAEHIPKIQSIVDQSYLFFMLAKAIRIRPDLANDPYVLQYCENLEDSVNRNPAQEFGELRRSFEDFLSDNEIHQTEIGYDPNYQTEIKSDLGSHGMTLSGGWIDSLIALPESKRGTPPPDNDQPF